MDIADRGPNYALIVFGAVAAGAALYDRLLGNHDLSTAEFIAAVSFGGVVLCVAALLQFLTENAIRAAVLSAQESQQRESLAAKERLIEYIKIAKEMGESDIKHVEEGFSSAIKAIAATNSYAAASQEADA